MKDSMPFSLILITCSLLCSGIFASSCFGGETSLPEKNTRFIVEMSRLVMKHSMEADRPGKSPLAWQFFPESKEMLTRTIINADNIALFAGYFHSVIMLSEDGFEYGNEATTVIMSQVEIFRAVKDNDNFWETLRSLKQKKEIAALLGNDARLMIDRWNKFEERTKDSPGVLLLGSTDSFTPMSKEVLEKREKVKADNLIASLKMNVSISKKDTVELLQLFIQKLGEHSE